MGRRNEIKDLKPGDWTFLPPNRILLMRPNGKLFIRSTTWAIKIYEARDLLNHIRDRIWNSEGERTDLTDQQIGTMLVEQLGAKFLRYLPYVGDLTTAQQEKDAFRAIQEKQRTERRQARASND